MRAAFDPPCPIAHPFLLTEWDELPPGLLTPGLPLLLPLPLVSPLRASRHPESDGAGVRSCRVYTMHVQSAQREQPIPSVHINAWESIPIHEHRHIPLNPHTKTHTHIHQPTGTSAACCAAWSACPPAASPTSSRCSPGRCVPSRHPPPAHRYMYLYIPLFPPPIHTCQSLIPPPRIFLSSPIYPYSYLRWCHIQVKVFNVGDYRRKVQGRGG